MSLTSEDRRCATRLLREAEVRIKIISAPAQPDLVGQEYGCSSIDISATGLRLLLEAAVVAGSRLTLVVSLPEQESALEGEVIWQRETEADGVYLVGIHFIGGRDRDAWNSLFL